ncbi:MAG: hypothetical protein JO234_15850 [Hyphomicrobiales bacterium]|nr:hypothetical protein [Hyphomicrobiales bacterium]
MTRTLISITALLSLSAAALAYGAAPTVTRQEIARADAATMHHDPADRYARNANNFGMEFANSDSIRPGIPT